MLKAHDTFLLKVTLEIFIPKPNMSLLSHHLVDSIPDNRVWMWQQSLWGRWRWEELYCSLQSPDVVTKSVGWGGTPHSSHTGVSWETHCLSKFSHDLCDLGIETEVSFATSLYFRKSAKCRMGVHGVKGVYDLKSETWWPYKEKSCLTQDVTMSHTEGE